VSAYVETAQLQLSGGRPSAGRADRRSPARLTFQDGWCKTIALAATQSNADDHSERVGVWVAPSDAILRATSAHVLLTDADRSGVATMRSLSAQNNAVAARILLRLALSQIVDRQIAPKEWRFRKTEFGQPLVCNRECEVKFSVSHSGSLIIVAAARAINLGVDVETIDQEIGEGVIEAFAHKAEKQQLDHLPATQKTREFVQLWTRKEAYTKLLGVGHSMEFSEIDCLAEGQLSEAHGPAIHFECFYVHVDRSLYHASLAINKQMFKVRPIHLSLSRVVAPDAKDGVFGVPVVN
jgi:phosphopantetheinyl transferase